jgi:excisionase family DNA binding protein
MNDELLTIEEATQRLRVGRTTVYLLMTSGELPSINIRRRRLIPASAVDSYIARKLQEAAHA